VLTVLTVLIEATAATQVRASTTSTATPAAVSRADRRRANVLAASPSRCHRITFAPLAADPVEKQDGRTGDPGWPAHGHESDTAGHPAEGTRSGGGRRATQPGSAARLAGTALLTGTARLVGTALLAGSAGGRSAAV
jgi:hypothetical protein